MPKSHALSQDVINKLKEFAHFLEGQWWETTDYDKLTIDNHNRPLEHVDRMRAWFKENGYMDVPGTIVYRNGKFIVHDGQARLQVCREQGLAYKFIVSSDYNIQNIHAMQLSTPWKFKNFAGFHAIDNEDYSKFVELHAWVNDDNKSSKMSMTTLLSILLWVKPGDAFYEADRGQHGVAYDFKHGQFKATDRRFSACRHFLDLLKEVRPYLKQRWCQREFVSAFSQMCHHKNYNHKQMVERLKTLGNKEIMCARGKIQIGKSIQSVYNSHMRAEKKIVIGWDSIDEARKVNAIIRENMSK